MEFDLEREREIEREIERERERGRERERMDLAKASGGKVFLQCYLSAFQVYHFLLLLNLDEKTIASPTTHTLTNLQHVIACSI